MGGGFCLVDEWVCGCWEYRGGGKCVVFLDFEGYAVEGEDDEYDCFSEIYEFFAFYYFFFYLFNYVNKG